MSVNEFYTFHKSVFEKWPHGDIKETWTDEAGNTCIRYSDNVWYHYRFENGKITFW